MIAKHSLLRAPSPWRAPVVAPLWLACAALLGGPALTACDGSAGGVILGSDIENFAFQESDTTVSAEFRLSVAAAGADSLSAASLGFTVDVVAGGPAIEVSVTPPGGTASTDDTPESVTSSGVTYDRYVVTLGDAAANVALAQLDAAGVQALVGIQHVQQRAVAAHQLGLEGVHHRAVGHQFLAQRGVAFGHRVQAGVAGVQVQLQLAFQVVGLELLLAHAGSGGAADSRTPFRGVIDLIDMKARFFDAGWKYSRQVFLATFDQVLHSSGPDVDPDAVDRAQTAVVEGEGALARGRARARQTKGASGGARR